MTVVVLLLMLLTWPLSLSLSLSLSAARVAPTRFFALLCREASGMGQNLIADADESLLEIEEGGRAGGMMKVAMEERFLDATRRYARGPTTMG